MSATQEVGDIFGEEKGSAQAMLRSPTVLILCVGLWGMNIFFYRLFGLDYRYILNYDLIEIEKEEAEKAHLHGRTSGSRSTLSRNGASNGSAGGLNHRRRRNKSDENFYLETATNDFDDNNSGAGSNDLEMVDFSIDADNNNNNGTLSARQVATSDTGNTSKIESPPESALDPSLDSGYPILWYKLVLFSVLLLFILHLTTHYWMDHLHRSSIGAVVFFYLSVLVYIVVPLRQNGWLRRSFGIVMRRAWALVHPRCSCITLAGTSIPPRRVPFVDVFFADAMCSLSKVFFDWGMLTHQAVHYPHPVPAATHNIVIPSLCAALPYLIRARQCLIMHTVGKLKRDPKKHHHLMNAFKYSTSMYPIILSAYLKTLTDGSSNIEFLESVLTILLILNASYSLWWDIVMDWGMMQDPYRVAQSTCGTVPTIDNVAIDSGCRAACLRPSLRFGLTLTVLIVAADSFLRFSWTLKFVPRLFPSTDVFVLCTQFLEVFRRSIWNLLRVEWENIKQQKHAAVVKSHSSDRDLLGPLESLSKSSQDARRSSTSSGSSASPIDPDDAKEYSVEMKILR